MPWIDSSYDAGVRVLLDGTLTPEFERARFGTLFTRAMTSARIRLTRNIKLRALRSHLTEPVVSFTFDDFPRSALHRGGRILRDAGWTGTFYAAGSFCGKRIGGVDYFDRDDLLQADRDGHEIGCHTFGHLNLHTTPAKLVLDDLRRNQAFVREILPQLQLTSFAYPFGDLDLRTKMLLARHFPICRGIWGGVNHGWIDFAQLRSVALERRALDETEIEAWLDRAQASNGWLVFFTHDISDAPSPYGCPTDVFARVVASVARRRMKVLTVKNAAGLAASPLEAIA